MSKPVQLQIRGDREVKEEWEKAKAGLGMSHGEFALAVSEFIQERRGGVERYTKSEKRPHGSTNESGRKG